MCAEVGHLELAHDYAYEAALIDLRDLHHNTRDGLHMASLAGAWTALVAGFGGLRDDEGILSLDPAAARRHLATAVSVALARLPADGATSTTHEVTYTLRDGPEGELTIRHAGEDLELSTSAPTTSTIKNVSRCCRRRSSHPDASRYTGAAAWKRRNRRGQPAELIDPGVCSCATALIDSIGNQRSAPGASAGTTGCAGAIGSSRR